MRICVFGASGPVGRAVVGQALDRGHDVVAVSRRPAGPESPVPGLHRVQGDVTDPARVRAAVDGADAVISVVGVNPSRRRITTYSVGITNVLGAMRDQGVDRIVSVSSKNLAEQGVAGEPLTVRLLVGGLLHLVNRTMYADMARMEQLLRDSDRNWTIVRPAGLFAADRLSTYRTTTGHELGVFTSTVDLAHALLAEVDGPDQHPAAVLEVLTDVGTPTLAGLIAQQAALHRRPAPGPASQHG